MLFGVELTSDEFKSGLVFCKTITVSARIGSRLSSAGRSSMSMVSEASSQRTSCCGYNDARYLQMLLKLKEISGLLNGRVERATKA